MDTLIAFRANQALHDRLKTAAHQQQCSLSCYIRAILDKHEYLNILPTRNQNDRVNLAPCDK